MTATNYRTTPRQLYRWNSDSGKWEPTATNQLADWQNILICDLFRPNALGVSRWIGYEELRAFYQRHNPDSPQRAFALFGGPGANGSNFFTRSTSPAAEFRIEARPGHCRHESRFNGLSSDIAPINQTIPIAVRRIITPQDCAFTGMHNTSMVVDHKDGRHNTASASVSDYQALTQPINKLKGTHCARCIASNKRFDARSLGYAVGWVHGNANYQGTCVGCYWHDIHHFRSSLILPPDHEP